MIHIGILSDGKMGHLNQTKGLAEALGRICAVNIHQIDLIDGPIWKKIGLVRREIGSLPPLHFLFAAGHRTHLTLALLRRWTKAKTVVLMKPSLPYALFDLAIVPEHDLHGKHPRRVIPSLGALNRVTPQQEKSNSGLILLGGPSRDYEWQGDTIRHAIAEITRDSPLHWTITNSRRTPEDFLCSLKDNPATLHPHEQGGPDWLPSMLRQASEVWVTEESVSMIFEALTSGARVGLLPMQVNRAKAKIKRLVSHITDLHYCMSWEQWQSEKLLRAPAQRLAEADRCARLLLEKFYPELL